MLFADSVEPLDEVMEKRARLLLLECNAAGKPAETFARLKELLRPHVPGGTEVVVRYSGPGAAGSLRLGPDWNVRTTDVSCGMLWANRRSSASSVFATRQGDKGILVAGPARARAVLKDASCGTISTTASGSSLRHSA